MARIRLQDVGFTYPGATSATLSPMSIDIADGEAFALLGASGAGKTTLLNLLSGILQPTQGRIFFDGTDVTERPGRERHLAQVFQFPVLYPTMTVEENLAFPLITRGSKHSRGSVDARVHDIAAELNIEGILKRPANAISLFEKQLVAVGRALVRPDVTMVLLDEPLTAVEPSIKWRLRQMLKRVQQDLGVTMIYVTHDQTEALTFADRVAILAGGEILQTGSPEEVYQQPAHEFVGHFLGSPGMNFLTVDALPAAHRRRFQDTSESDKIGFRPEDAGLGAPTPDRLLALVDGRQILGTQHGEVLSMYCLECATQRIFVRSTAEYAVGDSVGLALRQWTGFRQQRRVSSSGSE